MFKKLINSISPRDKFIALFFIRCIFLYLLWYLLYEKWLLEDGLIDKFLVRHLSTFTAFVLNVLGFETFQFEDAVGVDGTHGVLIGAPCNGLDLFALFAGFIIAFPGKIIHKTIYILAGILIVHIANIMRITALALTVVYYPESLQFNHKYTFTVLVYFLIFILWMIWVKKIAHYKNDRK